MEFEVIICTYNRPGPLRKLLTDIRSCTPQPKNIIVVDSSDETDEDIQKYNDVKYVRSSHKNQPYQRYVGYLVSRSEIVVYFDDDLQIANFELFKKILECYSSPSIAGVSIGIKYESVITSKVDNKVDSTSWRFKTLNLISGVPILKPGKIYLAGLAGPKPETQGRVEHFHGPFMSYRRTQLNTLFDASLFTLIENKMGVAEDKAISMKIGLRNDLWYLPELYLIHPPVDSHYFSDLRSFTRKATYFRLYLSGLYANLKNIPQWVAGLHFAYFMVWRILISSLKYLFDKKANLRAILLGQIDGVKLVLLNPSINNSLYNWEEDANKDAHRAA